MSDNQQSNPKSALFLNMLNTSIQLKWWKPTRQAAVSDGLEICFFFGWRGGGLSLSLAEKKGKKKTDGQLCLKSHREKKFSSLCLSVLINSYPCMLLKQLHIKSDCG